MNQFNPNLPSLRCPGCGQSLNLPAETCPHCSYNFRAGHMGPPGQPLTGPSAASPAGLGFKVSGSEVNLEPESGRNKLVRLAGGLLAALVLILVLFFIFRDDQSQEIAGPPPGGPRGEPMTIEQIRTDSPVLNPSKTINRARNLADTAEDRNQELKNIEKDLE